MIAAGSYLCLLLLTSAAVFGNTAVLEDNDEGENNPYADMNVEEKVLSVISSVVNRYCEDDHGFNTENDEAIKQTIKQVLMSERNTCSIEPGINPTEAPTELTHGPCTDMHTVNLTGEWRKDVGSNLKPLGGLWACDRTLQNGLIWFRFTGDAGHQLSNECRPGYSCGSHGGFWSDAEMPTEVGETRTVPIYGSWAGNCKRFIWPVENALTVQRCSQRPGDFVYKVLGTQSCFWAFCGMDIEETTD